MDISVEPLFLSVEGQKSKYMLVESDAITLLNYNAKSVEDFHEKYRKYRFIYSGRRIPWWKVISVKMEENTQEIKLTRSGMLIPASEEMTFLHAHDLRAFLQVLEKQFYFTRTRQQLTPWQAVRPMWWFIGFTLLVTVFSYYELGEMEQPDYTPGSNSKSLIFEAAIRFLGKGGVLGVGISVLTFVGIRWRRRFLDPPVRITYQSTNI
jgi:hypothetical protein